jgi:hypothetical protein
MGPAGTPEVLHEFSGGEDGATPTALIEGKNGVLYGATSGSLFLFSGQAAGTVFRLTPQGTVTTLRRFDPAYPFDGPVLLAQPSAVIEGFRGVFYGTTLFGGTASAGRW